MKMKLAETPEDGNRQKVKKREHTEDPKCETCRNNGK
jgi:hypothetical protein